MADEVTNKRVFKKWLMLSSSIGVIANIISFFIYIGEGNATWGNFRTYKGFIGIKFSLSLISDNNSDYKIYLKGDNPVSLIFIMVIASLITNIILIILSLFVFNSRKKYSKIVDNIIKISYIFISTMIAILHSYSIIIFNNTKDEAFHLLFRLYDDHFNSSFTYSLIFHIISIIVILINNLFINIQNDNTMLEKSITLNNKKIVEEENIVIENEIQPIAYIYLK